MNTEQRTCAWCQERQPITEMLRIGTHWECLEVAACHDRATRSGLYAFSPEDESALGQPGWRPGPPIPAQDPAGAAIGRCEAAELAADRGLSQAELNERLADALVIPGAAL